MAHLLRNLPLCPEDLHQLGEAYEIVLVGLRLKDRSDPITELVARRIFEILQTGTVDARELSRAVLAEFGSQSDSPVGQIGMTAAKVAVSATMNSSVVGFKDRVSSIPVSE
jgi:hypothetical protein